jgi:PAS domain S-box-containing protein
MTQDENKRLEDEAGGLRAEIAALRALVARLHGLASSSDRGASGVPVSALQHRLRTPLSAMMSLAEMMVSDSNLSIDQRENLELIYRSGERLLEQIHGTLDVIGPSELVAPAEPEVEAAPILIVDDAPTNVQLLSALLSRQGYAVRVAEDGLSAIESASTSPPDLILLDVMLPGMSGFEVCRRLKDDLRTREIPVLFLSALSSISDKLRGFAVGGEDYITKPFQAPEVIARVQTHLARRLAERGLRAGRARLEAILDHAPVGVALVDRGWRPQLANRRWAELLGQPDEQLASLSLLDLSVPEESAVRGEHLAALAAGATERYHKQARLLRGDGSSFWADLLVAPVRAVGQASLFVAILADITERKQVEAQILRQRQALGTLRERERLARELHDSLGQTLGLLNVQAQAAAAQLAADERAAALRSLGSISTAAQEALDDVREFLLGVNISQPPHQAERLSAGLRESLARYLQEFSRLAGLPAELVASPDVPAVLVPQEVELQALRIAQEALTNVRKHARATRVEVGLTVADERLHLTVSDDGLGFVPTTVGDGLHYGLRAMRERASEIGAELLISSSPGAGTTVSLVMPLRQASERVLPAFLLVDDHPLFLEGLRSLLVSHGVQVVGVAYDGRAALEQARALRPNVVLMDIEMPQMDGIEATRQIKAELPETRVVMLSASDQDDQVFEAIRAGAAGYLLKSLRADDLVALLDDLARGEAPLAPGLASRLLRQFAHPKPAAAPAAAAPAEASLENPPLSPRQIEVLTLVARGLTYKQVAATLSLSVSAVRYHMDESIKRLRLSGRTEAIAYAARVLTPNDAQH